MVTIREALLSVVGENVTFIQPIVEALSGLGFNEHAQAGLAFSLLEADQAAGLTVRQRLALKAAIQGALCFCKPLARELGIRGGNANFRLTLARLLSSSHTNRDARLSCSCGGSPGRGERDKSW